MTASNFQDDFVADDFEADQVDDFQADDFEPDQPKKEESSDFVKTIKSATRGIGTTLAEIAEYGSVTGSGEPMLRAPRSRELAPEGKRPTEEVEEYLPERSDEFGQKTVERFAKHASNPVSLIFGLPGLAYNAGASILGQAAEEAGFGTVGQTLAEASIGLPGLFKFGKELYQNPAARKQVMDWFIPESMKRKGGFVAKAEMKTTPAVVQKTFEKVGDDAMKRLENQTHELAEPFKRGEFNGKEILDDLQDITINKQLDTVGAKLPTKKEFGESLQNSIATQYQKAEAAYNPLYEFVESYAPNIQVSSKPEIELANRLIKDLNALETKPANFNKVINTLEDIKKDLGSKELPKGPILYDAKGNPIDQLARTEETTIPLTKKLELGRRINKVINYDIEERSIQDVLKPMAATVKSENKKALGKVSPVLEKAYARAEQEYGQTAQKFNDPTIRKIARMSSPERTAALIDQPSTLESLRGILRPEEYQMVERQVLENVKGMSPKKATETMKELSPYLSDRAVAAGENIVQFKDPNFFKGKWNKMAGSIVDELQEAFVSGTKPSNTLKLMQTKDGYRTVYETLHNTPNGRKALGYLQKQYIDDIVANSLTKDGALDWNKVSQAFNANETNRLIVRQVLGKEGLKEFEKMSAYADNIKHNFENYGPKAPVKLNSLAAIEEAFKKGALPVLGYIFGGIPLLTSIAGATALGKASIYMARRIVAAPGARKAVKELADPQVWKEGRANGIAQTLMRKAAEGDEKAQPLDSK